MANIKELAPGILMYEGVSENFDTLSSCVLSDDLLWSTGLIAANRDSKEDISNSEAKLNTEIRNCLSIAMPYDRKEIQDLANRMPDDKNYKQSLLVYDLIKPMFDWAEDDYLNRFSINYMSWHSRLELLKYKEGHFFDNHIDTVPGIPRTVSVVYYLNDNYEGGEIFFHRFKLKIKPKANSMLIFPSSYVYNHTAEKVISGTKIAVASFLN